MAGRIIPVRAGDVEVWIEAAPVAGSEDTSRAGDAARQVVDTFGEMEEVIVEVARRVARGVEAAAREVGRASSLEVEFGLKFSAQGGVIVASASAEASVRVTVRYGAGQES